MYTLHISQVLNLVMVIFFPRILLVKNNHSFNKSVREEKGVYMSNDMSTLNDIFCLYREYEIKTVLL